MKVGERLVLALGLLSFGLIFGLAISSEFLRQPLTYMAHQACKNIAIEHCLQARANYISAWGLFITAAGFFATIVTIAFAAHGYQQTKVQQRIEYRAYISVKILDCEITANKRPHINIKLVNYGRSPAYVYTYNVEAIVVHGKASWITSKMPIRATEADDYTVHPGEDGALMMLKPKIDFSQADYDALLTSQTGLMFRCRFSYKDAFGLSHDTHVSGLIKAKLDDQDSLNVTYLRGGNWAT